MMFRRPRSWQLVVVLAAICVVPLTAAAAPPSTCGLSDEYSKALCAYQHREFAAAEVAFRTIVDRNDPEPETLRALYFLARTEMKLGRYDEAEPMFIRIYEMSKTFYDDWSCDFLLGLCRKAEGKG